MKKQAHAYLYAGVTVLFWSTVASAFKLSLRYQSPQELLLFASLVSCCVLGVITIATGRHHELRSWTSRDFFRSSILGLLTPCLYYSVLFEAYTRLPAQMAQTLNFAWPIVLALLSIIMLEQPVSRRSVGAMCVSFSGVAVIATRGNLLSLPTTDASGILLALGSTVIWALYWIYGLADQRDPIVRLSVNFAFGTLFVFAYVWVSIPLRLPPLAGIAGAVYVGMFEMGVTFITWIMALRLSGTTAQVGNLIFLTPFLSLFFIRYAIGEPILLSTLVGLILIVTGIVLQQRYGD